MTKTSAAKHAQLVLQFGNRTITPPDVPHQVALPEGSVRYLTRTEHIHASVWLPSEANQGGILGILETIMEEDLLSILLDEVFRLRDNPILIVSRESVLDALQPISVIDGLHQGTLEGMVGFAHEPDKYQRLWWSTLKDWEGELCIRLHSLWYAAILNRVEEYLGLPPEQATHHYDWQQQILQRASANPFQLWAQVRR